MNKGSITLTAAALLASVSGTVRAATFTLTARTTGPIIKPFTRPKVSLHSAS
jgi:hypothetical protein